MRKLDQLESQNKVLKNGITEHEATVAEARLAIGELRQQLNSAEDALRRTVGELQSETTHSEKRSRLGIDNWSRRGWSDTPPIGGDRLSHVKRLWNSPSFQHKQAVAEADIVIKVKGILGETLLEATLLKAAILRDYAFCVSSPLEDLGRSYLETALALIQEVVKQCDGVIHLPTIWERRTKARFHMGLCLFEMCRYADAVRVLRVCAEEAKAKGHRDESNMYIALAQVELELERQRGQKKRKGPSDRGANAAAGATPKKKRIS